MLSEDLNVYFATCFSFPKSIKEIAEHATKVLKGFSSITTVVMSVLDNSYTNLIQEILCCENVVAWILVSRLSFKKEPVVVLLPVYSVLPGTADTKAILIIYKHQVIYNFTFGSDKADTKVIEERFFMDGIIPDVRTFLQEVADTEGPYSAYPFQRVD